MPLSTFEKLNEIFLKWFKNIDGMSFSPKIALNDYSSENAGRGVIAIDDIEEDEVLFSIPRKAVLSVETSEIYKKIPSMETLPDWPALILTMLYESIHDSFWKPYFDILPSTFDTPMFWNEEELEWLRGSSVCSHIGKEQAEQDYHTTIKPIIDSFPDMFPGKVSIDDYHRMGSLILAYSFGIDDTPEDDASENSSESSFDERKAMVPMADMLNADPRYNNVRIYHAPLLTCKG